MMESAPQSFKSFATWLLAFCLVVFGAQCWVVWLYGSDLPFWDQWDEGLALFKPWMEGHLNWRQIAFPASDHRMIVTHIWDMGLIRLNGRWEPLLQMVFNAIFHVLYAGGMAFGLWYFGGRKNGWMVCGLLLPFFILPFEGENSIWGFNSMWYLIYAFGLGAIIGLGFFKFGSWQWCFGLAAALLALLTQTLGIVPPLAVAGLMFLRAIKDRRLTRQAMLLMGVCLLIAVAGLAGGAHNAPNPLRAHSFLEFFKAIVRHLDWPFFNLPVMACIIPLPLIGLLVYYFRPNFEAVREAEFLLTLALWSVLESAMIAYGRANYGEVPASRYTEVFGLLLITSLFALILLCEQWQRDGVLNWSARLLPVVYAGILIWGTCRMAGLVVDNLLVQSRMMNLIAEERVTTFLASGKDSDLLENPTIRPDPATALAVMTAPSMQRILPTACVSPASALKESWMTPAAMWVLRHSTVIMMAGLVLFIGLCGLGLARKTIDLTITKPEGILALATALTALAFAFSNFSVQRSSVEYVMQKDLAGNFKAEGATIRAAYHGHKADELARELNIHQ